MDNTRLLHLVKLGQEYEKLLVQVGEPSAATLPESVPKPPATKPDDLVIIYTAERAGRVHSNKDCRLARPKAGPLKEVIISGADFSEIPQDAFCHSCYGTRERSYWRKKLGLS